MNAETRAAGIGRGLALALFAALCTGVWLDLASPAARVLRRMEPLTAMAALRFRGQDGILPPALYLAVYSPATRSLELVVLPPQTPRLQQPREKNPRTLADSYGDAYARAKDPSAGAAAMSRDALTLLAGDSLWPKDDGRRPDLELEIEVPADVRPAFPQELRSWLAPALSRPLFLLDFIRAARSGAVRWAEPPRLYDLVIIGRELGRLSARDVRLAQLPPGPALLRSFLGGVFGRARGLPESPAPVIVEVLNAADRPGIALRTAKVLRLQGLDVLHFGNAAGAEARTRFLDRTGRNGAAQAVARALGCPEEEVLSAPAEDSQVSVTAVLGRDFENCTRLREAP